MNHPPSEVIYALLITRFRSIKTWITSSRIPYSFALSTLTIVTSARESLSTTILGGFILRMKLSYSSSLSQVGP
uniref:Uncharacterized protein n=1 Tax=Arundo donax TaxID=35708 RepID=A0A0A9D7Q8_ARUDO